MLGLTYTRELDAAVTALRGGTPLLDVKVPVLATGGPDNADLVGDRVVPGRAYVSLQFLFSPLIVVQAIRGSSAHFSTRVCGFSEERFYSRLAAPEGKSGVGHFDGRWAIWVVSEGRLSSLSQVQPALKFSVAQTESARCQDPAF